MIPIRFKLLLILFLLLFLTGCNKQNIRSIVTLPAPTTEQIETVENKAAVEQTTQSIEPTTINEVFPETPNHTTEPITVSINCSEKELEVFRLINNTRLENGLCALTWDKELYDTAMIRAGEASCVWSHTRPDGTH